VLSGVAAAGSRTSVARPGGELVVDGVIGTVVTRGSSRAAAAARCLAWCERAPRPSGRPLPCPPPRPRLIPRPRPCATTVDRAPAAGVDAAVGDAIAACEAAAGEAAAFGEAAAAGDAATVAEVATCEGVATAEADAGESVAADEAAAAGVAAVREVPAAATESPVPADVTFETTTKLSELDPDAAAAVPAPPSEVAPPSSSVDLMPSFSSILLA